MKKCINPNCDSIFLFPSDKERCPFCNSLLVEDTDNMTNPDEPILPVDRIPLISRENDNRESDDFTVNKLNNVNCHGRIVELEHQELFNTKWQKLANSIIRGEPYQFSHQTIEYTIRVENISQDFPTEITDFCLFGNYLGRLHVGDEVKIQAKNKSHRRVVKRIYNVTSESVVKPGIQISAAAIRAAAILSIVAILAMIYGAVWLVKSGTLFSIIASLVSAFIPLIIVCVGIYYMVKSILPNRRRRR